jgi:hypothetical protein
MPDTGEQSLVSVAPEKCKLWMRLAPVERSPLDLSPDTLLRSLSGQSRVAVGVQLAFAADASACAVSFGEEASVAGGAGDLCAALTGTIGDS